MAARTVTDDTFEQEVLSSEKTVLVDFWAEWCGPCRALAPILDELAASYGEKIEVFKLNVDDNPKSAAAYKISSIPAIKVFQRGQVVKTLLGAKSKTALEQELASFI